MKATITKARSLVKQYLVSPKTTWEDFQHSLDTAINNAAAARPVRWYRTPSIEAEDTFKRICARAGVNLE